LRIFLATMTSLARIASRAALLALAAVCALAALSTPVGDGAPVRAQPSATVRVHSQAPLERKLRAALANAGIPVYLNGAVAIDLETGETVFAQSAGARLVPASNEKLPLTYALLSVLGPQYRISTEVLGQGERTQATWRGNLILKGYGDPDLSRSDLALLARRLRSSGLRLVKGDLIGDESFFDSRRAAPGWEPSYLVNECAPLSALSVDRGRNVGVSPPLASVTAFADALRAAGVRVLGKIRTGIAADEASALAEVESPPLWKLLRFMDRESDNYTAELLLKQLGTFTSPQGTTAGGAEVVMDVLGVAGVPMDGVRIVDGSGLSHLDRLTPAALGALLLDVWRDPALRKPFLSALAVAGRNGTLEQRMRRPPALGNVFGKTGTTDLASALSGFVRDRYAFAILENGNPVPFWKARVAQDRFATLLAAQ
jgi:D-alanyl-D-alanine carboxypeptidase/D-alanyl-D-alanine-endopeptidase (penicillin-binding protein 4)